MTHEQAVRLTLNSISSEARSLRLTDKMERIFLMTQHEAKLACDARKDKGKLFTMSLSQILEVVRAQAVAASKATIRRTMAKLVEAGHASVEIEGSRGKGLETVWGIQPFRPLVEAYPTALDLTKGGYLPGRQKRACDRTRAQSAVEGWKALTGKKPLLLRGHKLQVGSLLGKFPCSVPSQGNSQNPHPIVKTPPRAHVDLNGMAVQENSRKEGLPTLAQQEAIAAVSEALVKNLGADAQGAALRTMGRYQAQLLSGVATQLAECLSRFTPAKMPDLLRELTAGRTYRNGHGLLITLVKDDPKRVLRAAQAALDRDLREEERLASDMANLQLPRGIELPLSLRRPYVAWRKAMDEMPLPDAPWFLEAFDRERMAHAELVAAAESLLSQAVLGDIDQAVRAESYAADIRENDVAWPRVWKHHRGERVLAAAGLKPLMDQHRAPGRS